MSLASYLVLVLTPQGSGWLALVGMAHVSLWMLGKNRGGLVAETTVLASEDVPRLGSLSRSQGLVDKFAPPAAAWLVRLRRILNGHLLGIDSGR